MIPKILHQIWVGGPMPDHLSAYCRQLRDLHPDWEYRLWSADDLAWIRHRDLFDRWEELAPLNRGQFQANIARLEVLHRHGGIYLDCDMEPRKPLDPLLPEIRTGAFLVWQREPGHRRGKLLSNAAMGAEPDHPTIGHLIDGLAANVARNAGMRCTHTCGVKYVTRQLARTRLPVDRLPSKMFFPYLPDQMDRAGNDFPDAYAVHHWHNQRSGGHVGRWAR